MTGSILFLHIIITCIPSLCSYIPPTGDDTPIIKGSALMALQDPNGEWADKVMELMAAVDAYIPDPQRPTDKPFLMPVEDVFSITGRGTVATGRVERGVIKMSEEVEIVGLTEEKRKGRREIVDTDLIGRCVHLYENFDDPDLRPIEY